MIHYLDTSAVVKLFIHETGTEYVSAFVRGAGRFATSKICQPEFSAAMAKSVRMGICPLAVAEAARSQFSEVWLSVIKIEPDSSVLESASDLAWTHGLRGYDAVHLASAIHIGRLLHSPITILTYDKQLWDISRKIGLLTLPENL
jgi:uncharacterized protein